MVDSNLSSEKWTKSDRKRSINFIRPNICFCRSDYRLKKHMKILTVRGISLITFIILAAVICSAQKSIPENKSSNVSGYHLLNKIEVGGEGGWDYLFVDSEAHRLYVSHATKVVVIDTETDKIVGEIPNTDGVHGVAVAREFGRGFVSDGRDNAVTIFDLKTLKLLDTVKVGKNPDCIIYDSVSKRVFAFNRSDSTATAFDAKDGKNASTFDLGGHPEFAAADEKGMIYVNLDDKLQILAIDSRKLEIKNRWSVAPAEDCSGLAIDVKTRRLFAVCDNKKMIMMNADTGKVVAEVPIGDGPDAAGFDTGTHLVFSSNGEGSLTVAREDSNDKFSFLENVATQRGARTMAIDSKTHKIYLSTAQFGETPAPTAERPRPRPSIVPNSFVILVYGK
jgi:DNA-binding beta-propeller fold protein YncE